MGYLLIIFLTLSHFSIAQPEKGKGDFSLGEIALVVSNLHVGADATIDEPIKNKSLNGSLDIGTLKLGLSKNHYSKKSNYNKSLSRFDPNNYTYK